MLNDPLVGASLRLHFAQDRLKPPGEAPWSAFGGEALPYVWVLRSTVHTTGDERHSHAVDRLRKEFGSCPHLITAMVP